METFRDVVLSIAVILWIPVFVVGAAVFFLAQRYTGRGFAALDRLFARRLRPALQQTQGKLQQVRDGIGRLPGGIPVIEGEVRPVAPRRKKRLSMPFRKKRRLPIPFLR